MKEVNRVRRCGLATKTFLLGAALGLALTLTGARAGTDMKAIAPPQVGKLCDEKDWTAEFGTGVAFSNVRVGQPCQGYTMVPVTFCASLAVDEVSLDKFLGGVFRGNTEFFFRGDYDFITHGPEHWYSGIFVGPRYNFVQPGWKFVPFVEGGVGIGFADSNPNQQGLGQDFNFSFECSAGFKYLLTDDMFLRLAVQYQHVSNAGLSEPKHFNNQIDAMGPKLSIGFAF